jgi:hypothetical protein
VVYLKDGAAKQACSCWHLVPYGRAQLPSSTLRRSKCSSNSRHSRPGDLLVFFGRALRAPPVQECLIVADYLVIENG